MLLDSHQHFWKYHPKTHSWITDEMFTIRKDFLPKHLAPVLKENKVDGCILVQSEQTEGATQQLIDWAQKNPFVKGIVGWVNLLDEKSLVSCLEKYKQYSIVKGFRHIVQAEATDFLLDKNFKKGLELLATYNYTFDLLIREEQLPKAISLVAQLPQQSFVLDHLAKPSISNGVSSDWEKYIRELAKYPNVYAKLSGMVTETKQYIWKKEEFRAFLDIMVDCFGVNRLMFGSDWPVCLVVADYKEVLGLITDYFSSFSTNDYLKVMGLNATHFYNIQT